MKLTKDMKSRLKGLILTEKFKAQNVKVLELEKIVGDVCYNHLYTEAEISLMNSLPEGWMREVSRMSLELCFPERSSHELKVWRNYSHIARGWRWEELNILDPSEVSFKEVANFNSWETTVLDLSSTRRASDNYYYYHTKIDLEVFPVAEADKVVAYLLEKFKRDTYQSTLAQKIDKVLETINSTKKLLEVLPEAEKYVAQLKPECSDIPVCDAAADLRGEI